MLTVELCNVRKLSSVPADFEAKAFTKSLEAVEGYEIYNPLEL